MKLKYYALKKVQTPLSNIDGQCLMAKEGLIKYLEEVIEQKVNEISELKQSCE